MRPYLIHIRMNLRLTRRDRTVLFFNYLFPLIFFFLFGQLMHAEQGGVATQVVNMVLSIGVLGNGFFGAGMRSVMDREQNILRRFKVAPIGPGPILVSSMVTGVVHYLPLVVLVLGLAHFVYGMPVPERIGSLLIFLIAGVLAFRSIGGMIGAVVNSMQESQIIIQLLYFPMLFLGGVAIPTSAMPAWVQVVGQFLPSTHLTSGLQGILRGRESLMNHLPALGALALTVVVSTFLATKLFRWEKEEKLKPGAKMWLLLVFAPFLLIGAWQAKTKDNLALNKVHERDLRRSRTWLIHDARLFLGDGQVIERGSVLVKEGRIAAIYRDQAPEAKALKAEVVEAAGKTLLPGLIDVHVHLSAPGGFYEKPEDYRNIPNGIDRELAQYLFSGVTAVKSLGDPLDLMIAVRRRGAAGEKLGAELFAVGPMFTAEGGHGTEYLKYMPEAYRTTVEQQLVRLPKSPQEARTEVAELKARGVDGIKVILDGGVAGALYNRLDTAILDAIAEAGRALGLPVVSHTGNSKDVADALAAKVDGVEHGSHRDLIPVELFAAMKQANIAYDPTVAVVEAIKAAGEGDLSALERSLVQQTAPQALLTSTRKILPSAQMESMRRQLRLFPFRLDLAKQNLLAAYKAGVPLVTGTDSGNPLMVHGPAIHRELQLWVEAGIPPAAALQAATASAAKLLRADNRIGMIRQGFEANLLLVDGNPLSDISATERISAVFFKGERVARADLFDEE